LILISKGWRYLAVAWQSGAIPVIVLTKTDLMEGYDDKLAAVNMIAPGVDICAISSVTGDGIDTLSAFAQPGKTIVLLASSGVGKSSLVNAIAGEDIMLVKDIRDDDSKGRHTTTHRQLITLKDGVMIIDTPGMRELGLWDVSLGLGEAFGDVDQYVLMCKFADCNHKNEPGCAVKQAIEEGKLSYQRLDRYEKLKKEAKYADRKAKHQAKKQQQSNSISKNKKKPNRNKNWRDYDM